ncbi:RNA 2',3'-cyclic phosphodiesterase [Polaromonas jejuensis]|uniref:RNA 2',3'-cyclic phosphodiesterase n=1 Tax=Polaromonas jejuensis TaxID=457502 RepID=A0ABW0QCN1_9BURK|nr:RNA 2',3'-cyclic phosphodiesterase [Polaromonas jejuensis]
MTEDSPTARLFLALWPDQRVREALAHGREAWTWPAGVAWMPPQMLHLTLHFIGPVAVQRLPQLRPSLAVPFTPFSLRLDRPELWRHGIAVLRPEAPAPGLLDLHAALREALCRLALPTEERAFDPHVTLARRAGRALPPPATPPIDWRVEGYALAASMRDAPGDYRILQRYA